MAPRKLDIRGHIIKDYDPEEEDSYPKYYILTDGKTWPSGTLSLDEIYERFHNRKVRIRIEVVD